MPSEHHRSSWLCSKCLTIDRDQNHLQWWHQYPQWSSVWINSDNYQSSNGWLSSFCRYWCRRKKTAVKGIASPGKYNNNRRLSWFTRFIIIFITAITAFTQGWRSQKRIRSRLFLHCWKCVRWDFWWWYTHCVKFLLERQYAQVRECINDVQKYLSNLAILVEIYLLTVSWPVAECIFAAWIRLTRVFLLLQ